MTDLEVLRRERAQALLAQYDPSGQQWAKDEGARWRHWDGHTDVLTITTYSDFDGQQVRWGFCVEFQAGTADVRDYWFGG